MEPDDLLCSRNARPRKSLVGRAQWKINQPPSLRDNERAWKGSVETAACSRCSQIPHDETVVARCAQSRATLTVPFSRCLEQRRGWSLRVSCARATRGLRRERGEPPDHPSCSRNAHDQNVLVRRAHSRINQAASLKRK
jgi:hypothetical protein